MSPAQESLFWRLWAAACRAQGWKSSDDEKRHAVYVSALGYDKSHKQFTWAEVNKVFAKLKALAQPDDLDAQAADAEAQRGEDRAARRNYLQRIPQLAPEAYVRSLIVDLFDKSRVEDLTVDQLKKLTITLAERKRVANNKEKTHAENPF